MFRDVVSDEFVCTSAKVRAGSWLAATCLIAEVKSFSLCILLYLLGHLSEVGDLGTLNHLATVRTPTRIRRDRLA